MKIDHKRSLAALIIIREKLAVDLSDEINMQRDEAYEIIKFAFDYTDELPTTYDQLKKEIKSYIIINIITLITKLS